MYFIFEKAPILEWITRNELLIYVTAAAIGVFLAFFAYWFVQSVIGGLVRKILERGVGEENAASLTELKKNTFIYRFFLRNGSTLRNLISCVGGELEELKKADGEDASKEESTAKEASEVVGEASEDAKEPKPTFKERAKKFFSRFKIKRYDYENAKFYISADNEKKAKDRHSRTMSALWLPLIFVLCVGCAIGIYYLFPVIMDLISNQ